MPLTQGLIAQNNKNWRIKKIKKKKKTEGNVIMLDYMQI